MSHDNRPIGIFDSGLGGLTVAAALRAALPGEHLVYLGDTARVPYGSKSRDTIVRFALEDAAFLLEHEVKAVVVACNSVSAVALPALRERWPAVPFLGVVEAGAQLALEPAPPEDVVVIGTAATVASDAYRKLLHRRAPQIRVRSIACPLFVPLVEEGWVAGDVPQRICETYLQAAVHEPPDVLILGCTHYPLLRPLIANVLPAGVPVVDSAEACAVAVQRFLAEHGMAARGGSPGRQQYYVTDLPSAFLSLAGRFLGAPLPEVDKVSLS